MSVIFFFFFSSRRRHTRWTGDWSSDVCSSDLASGQGGTAAGLADALFPLDGVVAPTFSAYEIAASFLLPFVAIRAVAGDRVSGALKLELQQGMTPLSMVGAKALVLGAGWFLAGVPIVLAGIMWISYGGSLYAPEVGSL